MKLCYEAQLLCFKSRDVFTGLQPAATIFQNLRDSHQERCSGSIDMLSTMSPPPQVRNSLNQRGVRPKTLDYKCNELKWPNYSVGGKRSGFPLMRQDCCQDVSRCRLFCFYHMCCVAHFQVPPRAKITTVSAAAAAAAAWNLSEHVLEQVYDQK